MKNLIISLRVLLGMTILTGLLYPALITSFAQIFFPHKANGSLVYIRGKLRGSELIGQDFSDSTYFFPRPSACDYNTVPGGASNLATGNKKLIGEIQSRKTRFIELNGLDSSAVVPNDMLFASASGLDPDISLKSALLQCNRVAGMRNFSATQKQELTTMVKNLASPPQFSLFGETKVNVFKLNLELNKLDSHE